jgi:hypothetical protein
MSPSKPNIESLFEKIRCKICNLNVEDDFRVILSKDIELAEKSFQARNILSTINCLTVLIGKLHTYVIFSSCSHSDIKWLLVWIHRLQDILTKLPLCTIGPSESCGATGVTGPAGIPCSMRPAGPSDAAGPTESVGRTSVFTSTYPVCCFPVAKKASSNSVSHNFSPYTQIQCPTHGKIR